MAMILLKNHQTKADYMKSIEAGGKKRGRVAGGWVADLAELKKCITLCPECTPKFNPAKVGYRKEKEFPVCQAKCDGCSTWDIRCSAYFHETVYSDVRSTAEERRALAKDRERRIKRGYL